MDRKDQNSVRLGSVRLGLGLFFESKFFHLLDLRVHGQFLLTQSKAVFFPTGPLLVQRVL